MNETRCEEVFVQLVARSYDKMGRPIGEQTTQPIKLFRATTPDFWAFVDKTIGELLRSAAEPPPMSPGAEEKTRKRG